MVTVFVMEDRSGRIERDGARLIWRQVHDDLVAMMDDGTLPPGARLPADMELADHVYKVARGTVRRAVAELVTAGRVEVVHGRGTFVR